ASLSTIDRDVMSQAIRLTRGALSRECENCALSDEVGGGVVFVQVCKDRRERFARVQLLRGLRIFGVHEHHEVSVFRKERYLAFRISAIGTVRVSLDKLAYGQPIRSFGG